MPVKFCLASAPNVSLEFVTATWCTGTAWACVRAITLMLHQARWSQAVQRVELLNDCNSQFNCTHSDSDCVVATPHRAGASLLLYSCKKDTAAISDYCKMSSISGVRNVHHEMKIAPAAASARRPSLAHGLALEATDHLVIERCASRVRTCGLSAPRLGSTAYRLRRESMHT
jgi:mevalonate pyrophosphate decarboxylase